MKKLYFLIFLLYFSFAYSENLWNKSRAIVNEIDNKTFVIINQGFNSKILDFFMTGITMLGHGLVLVPIVGLILFLNNKNTFKNDFLFFIIVLILGGFVIQVLKFIINRPRPINRFSNIKIVFEPLKEHSFPSGHAQSIFTAGVFLSKKIKKLKWLFFLLAVLVGISRIYTGVHFLSDVIAGAIIGICITEWAYLIFKEKSKCQINCEHP